MGVPACRDDIRRLSMNQPKRQANFETSPILDICALAVHVPGAWRFRRNAVTRL